MTLGEIADRHKKGNLIDQWWVNDGMQTFRRTWPLAEIGRAYIGMEKQVLLRNATLPVEEEGDWFPLNRVQAVLGIDPRNLRVEVNEPFAKKDSNRQVGGGRGATARDRDSGGGVSAAIVVGVVVVILAVGGYFAWPYLQGALAQGGDPEPDPGEPSTLPVIPVSTADGGSIFEGAAEAPPISLDGLPDDLLKAVIEARQTLRMGSADVNLCFGPPSKENPTRDLVTRISVLRSFRLYNWTLDGEPMDVTKELDPTQKAYESAVNALAAYFESSGHPTDPVLVAALEERDRLQKEQYRDFLEEMDELPPDMLEIGDGSDGGVKLEKVIKRITSDPAYQERQGAREAELRRILQTRDQHLLDTYDDGAELVDLLDETTIRSRLDGAHFAAWRQRHAG